MLTVALCQTLSIIEALKLAGLGLTRTSKTKPLCRALFYKTFYVFDKMY
ncbi:hypothetical protein HMPREF9554_02491 [Treponema phagedenis F0421]|nr:hypothetical protein HMPREF9554_02491 [Treponema phagedenis F0421]